MVKDKKKTTKKTLKKTVKKENKNEVFNEGERKILSLIMFLIVGILGITYILIGTYDMLNKVRIDSSYKEIDAKICAYNTNDKNEYIITYSYIVDSKEYIIQSEHAVKELPKQDETIKVLYNVNNHNINMFIKEDQSMLYILIGLMMLSLPVVLYLLDDDMQKDISNSNVAVIVILLGIFFYIVAARFLNTFNIIKLLNGNSLFVIMPIIFIIIGIYAIIKIQVYKKEQNEKRIINNVTKILKKKK